MTKRLALALFMAALSGTIVVLPAHAQRGFLTGRGPGMGARPHVPFRGGHQGGYLTGPRGRFFDRGFGSNIYPYYPYYYPGYYSGYYYGQASPEQPPTRVVVVQNSQPRAEAPPPPPPNSLVLELQGDHWVRLTSSGQTEAAAPQPEQKGSAKATVLRTITPQESAALETSRELPPAVLVFRDGHKEEITRYTIVGGTIYTNTDYWINGTWTKKVPIAELNIPATLKLNRERGAKFSLPSGPGVIVVRP